MLGQKETGDSAVMSVILAPGGARAAVAREGHRPEAHRTAWPCGRGWVAFETKVKVIHGVSNAAVGNGPEQESGGNMAFTPGWGMNGGRVSCITERNWDREVASFLRGGDCRADIFI